MDTSVADRETLIHPAFRARILTIGRARIRRDAATARSLLEDIDASFRACPELAELAATVEPALRLISACLLRWSDGEPPVPAELEAVEMLLRTIRAALPVRPVPVSA